MKQLYKIIVFVCVINLHGAEVIIRCAKPEDVRALLTLDRDVTYEFFKPLYMKHYSHLPIGKNPDYFLELELKNDEQSFLELITQKLICITRDSNNCVGLLSFHKDNNILHLDLLLIDHKYRRRGIGRKLIMEILQQYKDVEACVVYPLQCSPEALAFYESLGFVKCEWQDTSLLNIYGIPYADMQYHYRLNLKNNNE